VLEIHEEKVPLAADEHGTLRVAGTRVALSAAISSFENGLTPEDIVDAFDSLALADVYSVLGYYLRHEKDIRADLDRERAEGEALRREIEGQFSPNPLRKRLQGIKRNREASPSQ